MTSRALLSILAVVALTTAAPARQVGTLRFISPPPDSYVSGPVLLKVAYEGDGGASAVADVTFFADGRQVCVANGPRMECEWNAGRLVDAHALRAVARLKSGGRAVANARTKGLEFAQSVSVDIVQVNVVVTDGGRFVKGLPREAFRLLDDQQERPITSLQPAGAPLEIVLALDVSGSMRDALPHMQAAARAFLTALGAGHQVTIVAFNDDVFTLAQRESNVEARLQAIQKLSAWGGTALYDVVLRSIDLLSQQAGRRAVVVFSDGEDRSSQATLDEVRRRIDESDATLFTVGLGRGSQQQALRDKLEGIAQASGGLALFTDDPDELAEPFADIVENLSNQYTIGFEPRRDGKYHALTVQVPGRGYRVRARRGYVAPAQ